MPRLKKVSCLEILNYAKKTGLYKYSNIVRDFDVNNFCSLSNCDDNSIVFIKNSSVEIDFSKLKKQNMLIISVDLEFLKANELNYIISDRPRDLYFHIINNYKVNEELIGVSCSSKVYTEKIGKNVYIGDNVYVYEGVTIGNNVKIYPNVSICCPCTVDDNTVIFSGAVIGTDGFGMYMDKDGIYHQIPHVGGVKIGKNVIIGANTCIDRGTIDDTIIEDNVKIDNLCHIGHNVIINENTLITAGTIFGGSSITEKNVYFAPGSIIKNGIRIGKNSLIGMGSVVLKNVDVNQVVVGIPAKFLRENK